MLGLPQQESKSLVGLATIREWIFGMYFRDRWQISSKLTATLGLRWEYYPLPTRDHRGIERYDPETNKVYIGGIGGVPDNAGSEASKKGFAPRVGLAYRISSRHVLRTGYGITIDPFSIGRSMRSNYPDGRDRRLERTQFVPAVCADRRGHSGTVVPRHQRRYHQHAHCV